MGIISKSKLFLRRLLLSFPWQLLLSILISSVLTIWLFRSRTILEAAVLLDLLKWVIEINGVLLGFVIAFFLFISQSNQDGKLLWFFEFRKNVDALFDVHQRLSEEKNSIAEQLEPVIEALDLASIENIPYHVDDRVEMYTLVEKLAAIRQRKRKLISRKILSILLQIENSLNNLGLIIIRVIIAQLFLKSTKKLAFQIVLGFTVLILWKFVFVDLSVHLVFFFFFLLSLLTCGSFGELVTHLSDHYRDSIETEYESDSDELEGHDFINN